MVRSDWSFYTEREGFEEPGGEGTEGGVRRYNGGGGVRGWIIMISDITSKALKLLN